MNAHIHICASGLLADMASLTVQNNESFGGRYKAAVVLLPSEGLNENMLQAVLDVARKSNLQSKMDTTNNCCYGWDFAHIASQYHSWDIWWRGARRVIVTLPKEAV